MSGAIAFRQLGLDGIDHIMPVMQLAFPPDFGEAWNAAQVTALLMLPGTALVAAERDERIVGFALSRSILDECELLLLAVDPAARRRGVARAMLDQVTTMAAAQGVRQLTLEVRESNIQALSLYADAGFFETGRRPNYYRSSNGLLLDALTMKLTIRS